MALYSYVKENNSPKRKIISYFSYFSLVLGSLLMFWSFYPIISFEIYSKVFLQERLYSPVRKSEATSFSNMASSVLGSSDIRSSDLKDFTEANLWFPTRPQGNSYLLTKESSNSAVIADNSSSSFMIGASKKKLANIKEFILSIPKLGIKDAKVVVGGNDLTRSLIQYDPKSLPGENGNVIIFGHSTLPQLYNSRDYKTIFTYLPSLENNDKIYIKVDDQNYEYTVYEMFVVEPDQVSVLEQKTDAAYLTLITCVPPGTYWKRLIVRAKFSPFK